MVGGCVHLNAKRKVREPIWQTRKVYSNPQVNSQDGEI